MEKVSDCCLTPAPLCLGFFDGNFERGFLTTRGLLLLCLRGISSFKMSMINLEKKKAVVRFGYPGSREWRVELLLKYQ